MNLTDYIKSNPLDKNWLDIANRFSVEGTTKQKSDKVRKLYHRLQKNQEGIHIILGCMHVPSHNKVLVSKILELIKNQNVIGFHLIGDFLDLKSLSPHEAKRLNTSTLGSEYKEGNNVLDLFDSVLPKSCKKTYIFGNHEEWFYKFKSDLKNQTFIDAVKSPAEALNLKERGYTVLEDWKDSYIQIGDYQIFHGIYCSTNPVKAHIDKIKSSCIFAHTHRSQVWFESQYHGINTGHLADINSNSFNYVSRIEKLKWQSGFAIINQNNNTYQAELITCKDNSFFFGGKKY